MHRHCLSNRIVPVGNARFGCSSWGLAAALLAASVLTGCGRGSVIEKEPIYQVTGKLTMDGQPLGPATLRFTPVAAKTVGEKRSFTGTADGQGNISFTTYKAGDGAPAGQFNVTVSPSLMGETATPIPAVYQSKEATPLAVTIAEKTGDEVNQITIDLDSKAGPAAKMPGSGGTMKGIDPSVAFPGAKSSK